MKGFLLVAIAVLIGLQAGFADEGMVPLLVPPDSPVFSGIPVAIVNNEEITLKDLHNEVLERTSDGGKDVRKIDYPAVLDRLISIKLIVQEARNIGIDELPEIKQLIDSYSKITLREQLMEDQVKGLKPDEADVEKLYKDAVKEWKIKSVLFEKEDDAKKMLQEIEAGGSFDGLIETAIKSGTAKGDAEGQFLKPEKLLPQIAEAVSKLKTGAVSPVIQIDSGFVVLKLEDVRYPEDPKAKEWATQEALNYKKGRAIQSLDRELKEKYTKVNKKVFDSIDYDSKKPGIEKLLKDKRVVAEIKGEKPVTVAELSAEIRQKFYHGIERAAESKKVNERKADVLGELLHKRVFRKEALRRGIHKTEKYMNLVKTYEESVIFGAFVQKIVVPDVKLTLEEVQEYYNRHISEYSFPEMLRLHSLAFFSKADAESAVEKLKKGTDFKWLRENAEGQVDKNTPGLLKFDGSVLTLNDLPADMQKVLSAVNPGDSRFYSGPDNFFYALYVQDVIPSKKQPFEAVKDVVGRKVFNEKLNNAIDEWTDKLREASDIKIYLRIDDKDK